MKCAILSDIHGNSGALEAVMKDIEGKQVDSLISLGDVVGYGCDPSRCLEIVAKNCGIRMMGNHEYLILGRLSSEHYNKAARVSAEWTMDMLTERELTIISQFQIEYDRDGIYFTHGSPKNPEQWNYILTPEEALVAFENFTQSICFCGHTHVPMIFAETEGSLPRCQAGHDFLPSEDTRYIINVGSVGQPRDKDPRACYVTFDTEELDVEYHRVEYDIQATQRKMAEVNLPEMLIERLAVGR